MVGKVVGGWPDRWFQSKLPTYAADCCMGFCPCIQKCSADQVLVATCMKPRGKVGARCITGALPVHYQCITGALPMTGSLGTGQPGSTPMATNRLASFSWPCHHLLRSFPKLSNNAWSMPVQPNRPRCADSKNSATMLTKKSRMSNLYPSGTFPEHGDTFFRTHHQCMPMPKGGKATLMWGTFRDMQYLQHQLTSQTHGSLYTREAILVLADTLYAQKTAP